MRRRRALVFGGILLLPLVVLGVACSFPDVEFVPANDSGTNGETSSTSSSSSSSTGGPADGDVLSDSGDKPDVGPIVEAGPSDAEARVDGQDDIIVDASLCSMRPTCDCDQDKYYNEECAKDAGDGGIEGGLMAGDCDDRDPVRNPAATYRQDMVPSGATHQGDWNCDNKVERSPQINLTSCPEPEKVNVPDPPLGLTTHPEYVCKGGAEGFRGAPPCGTTADTVKCPTGQFRDKGSCTTPVTSAVNVTALCR